MKLKQIVIMLSMGSLLTVGVQAEPTVISVTGTADWSIYGYNADQSYTFNYTVNNGYTGGSGDEFTSSGNQWYAKTTDDPYLYSSISGDGLSGSYSRPSGTYGAPRDWIKVNSSRGLELTAGNDDPDSSSTGLTFPNGGGEIELMGLYNLHLPNLDYSHTSFVDPVIYLSGYYGTYTPSGAWMNIINETGQILGLTVTSVTIQGPVIIPPPVVNLHTAVEVEWSSVSGQTYQVQYSTNLASSNWFDLGDSVMATNTASFMLDSTRGVSNRFYRVINE